MSMQKDMMGEYFHEKKKKRDRLTGHVTTPGTAVTLVGEYYTQGPFIAEAIWVCNGDTTCHTFQILDGTTALTCNVVIAPSCDCCLDEDSTKVPNFYDFNGLTWMPFFTAVNINSDSALVTVTMGGWIP